MKIIKTASWIVTYKGQPLKDSSGGIYLHRLKKEASNIAASKSLSDPANMREYGVTKAYIAFNPT